MLICKSFRITYVRANKILQRLQVNELSHTLNSNPSPVISLPLPSFISNNVFFFNWLKLISFWYSTNYLHNHVKSALVMLCVYRTSLPKIVSSPRISYAPTFFIAYQHCHFGIMVILLIYIRHPTIYCNTSEMT